MVYLYSLLTPILLLPVEKILPIPYFVEEIAKYVLIKIYLSQHEHGSYLSIVALATTFTLSESMIYFQDLILMNRFLFFVLRVLITGLLHITTMVLIYWGIKKSNKIGLLTLSLSMIIHTTFNWFIGTVNFLGV